MRFLSWGITSSTPVHQLIHLRFANALFLALFLLSLIQTAILFFAGNSRVALANSTAPLCFGGALLLMRAGFTQLARVMMLIIANVGAYWVATLAGFDSQFHILLLVGGVFSILLFPVEQKLMLTLGFTLSLSLYLLLEYTDFQPIFGEQSHLEPQAAKHIRVGGFVIFWAVFYFSNLQFVFVTRTYQNKLFETTKLAALGQMAAGISHEINNPLTVVLGNSERMIELANSPSIQSKEIVRISESINQMAVKIHKIVRGLLAVSRESGQDPLTPIPLSRVVHSTLTLCEARLRNGGIKLKVSDIPSEYVVMGRESQLDQVLLNLINNSIDALNLRFKNAPSGGEAWIEVSAARKGSKLELSVADNGSGIPTQIRDRLFEPFYTTKPVGKGTGLGLSIAQGIIESHGGTLFYDASSPNTRFVIQFPSASA